MNTWDTAVERVARCLGAGVREFVVCAGARNAALLEAVCVAPSARRWAVPLVSFEVLLLRELGYGVSTARPADGDWQAALDAFDKVGGQLERYLLAERRSDVMAARAMLGTRLKRIEGSVE